MNKIDISKFIKENNNPYSDSLDTQIENIEMLVEKNIISSKFAKVLMSHLIKKEVGALIEDNIRHITHNHGKKDKWIYLNYSRKNTNYM